MVNPIASGDRRSGVYQIVNRVNHKVYVGSAVNLRGRCQDHERDLKAHKHRNDHLQKAWDRYGEDAFTFQVLEYVGRDELITTEQYWIDTQRELGDIYNISPTAGSTLGRECRLETRIKIGNATRGRKLTPEQCAAHGAARKGRPLTEKQKHHLQKIQGSRPHTEETKALIGSLNKGKSHPVSEETKAKISAGNKGKKRSPEAVAKTVAANEARGYNRGIKRSDETRAKMSAASKGRAVKEEAKQKISASLKRRNEELRRLGIPLPNVGRVYTDETKAKMSAGHKGYVPTEETRARLSEAQKKRYAEDPDARRQAGNGQRGKPGPNRGRVFSPEARAKMSASQKERQARLRAERASDPNYVPKTRKNKTTPEERSAATAERNRNRVWTEEARQRSREAHKGQVVTAEQRAKMSERQKQRVRTPEELAAMSARFTELNKARVGTPLSEEHKSAIKAGITDEQRARTVERNKNRIGGVLSEENKALLSTLAKERWEDPEFRARMTAVNIETGRKRREKNNAES